MLTRLLVLAHLLLAPGMLVGRAADQDERLDPMEVFADLAPSDNQAPGRTWIWLSGHELFAYYVPVINAVNGRPHPRRTVVLAPSTPDAVGTFVDDHSVRVHSEAGMMAQGRFYWTADQAFSVGETRRAPDFTATIEAVTDDGRPRTVLFQFDDPTGSDALEFVRWIDRKPVPWTARE